MGDIVGYRDGVKKKGDKIGMNYIHGVYSTIIGDRTRL